MNKTTTIKALIETGVSGLKEYLTESEKRKMVDFILKWSYQSINDKMILIASSSKVGITEEQATTEIMSLPFISFFWRTFDVENKVYSDLGGLPSREWMLKSHREFSQLEDCLLLQDNCPFDPPNGEFVSLVNGRVESYTYLTEEIQPGLPKTYIQWTSLEPYELTFSMEGPRGVETIKEQYNCKRVLELRILRVLEEGGTKLSVYDNLSAKTIPFVVTVNSLYDSRHPLKQMEKSVQWLTCYIDDEDEEEMY